MEDNFMKAKNQLSIKKLLACVLSLAVIFSAFVFTSVSADTETVILDWSNYNGYSGGGFHFVKDDPTGYVHVTATDKELSENSQIADLLNWWGWSAAGYDKIKFTAYTASGSCDIRMVYGDNVETANTTISATPTVITYDVTSDSKADVKFQLDAGSKGAIVSVDLYIGDVYGVVVATEPEYSVTIDGENKGNFSSFTFPESTAAGFIAYTDGTNYYAANETVTITEAKDFTTVSYGALTMKEGSSIRLSNKSGIRFYTPIDAAKIAELKGMGATLELGTLISPKDLVGSELTFDLAEANYINVPYLATRYFEDAYVVGSLVEIKDTNVTREFVGRGYIKVTLGGVSVTIYADYAGGSVDNNARSIASIATAYKNDNHAGYEGLNEDLKALVDKWVAALANSNTVAGIDTTKIEAAGKAGYDVDKANNEIIVYVDNWDASATGDYIKFNVSGLKQGTISAYLGKGAEDWKSEDRGAHYGVEIDGVVYWDSQWDDGTIKVETKGDYIGPDFDIVGKTMYELSSFAGNDSIQGEKQITADDLANITAVYIHPGYHMNGQYVHITNVK